MKGLMIKANMIDAREDFIDEIVCENPMTLSYDPQKSIGPLRYATTRYLREEYSERGVAFPFFIDPENEEAIKSFLEDRIYEAMRKTGYDDASNFRKIKENYGEEISKLLVKGADDPDVKQQLKRMLDF